MHSSSHVYPLLQFPEVLCISVCNSMIVTFFVPVFVILFNLFSLFIITINNHG